MSPGISVMPPDVDRRRPTLGRDPAVLVDRRDPVPVERDVVGAGSISRPSKTRAFVRTSIGNSSSRVAPRVYSAARPRWLSRQSGGNRSSLSRTELVRPRSSTSRSSSMRRRRRARS